MSKLKLQVVEFDRIPAVGCAVFTDGERYVMFSERGDEEDEDTVKQHWNEFQEVSQDDVQRHHLLSRLDWEDVA